MLPDLTVEDAHAIGRYLDDLVRECQLIEVGVGEGVATTVRVRNLADGVLAMARVRELQLQVVDAAERGADELDLVLAVTDAAADRVAKLRELLDDVAELQRQGMLLLEPLPPTRDRLLRWCFEQISRQVTIGATPAPFDPEPG